MAQRFGEAVAQQGTAFERAHAVALADVFDTNDRHLHVPRLPMAMRIPLEFRDTRFNDARPRLAPDVENAAGSRVSRAGARAGESRAKPGAHRRRRPRQNLSTASVQRPEVRLGGESDGKLRASQLKPIEIADHGGGDALPIVPNPPQWATGAD